MGVGLIMWEDDQDASTVIIPLVCIKPSLLRVDELDRAGARWAQGWVGERRRGCIITEQWGA